MKTAIIALSVALSLTGCAKLQNAYEAITTSNVPPKAIYVAVSSFDAAKVTATNWVVFCSPNPSPAGCDDKVIKTKIIPAMNKGTNIRKELVTFLADHPGELGAKGTVDALILATNTITANVGD